MENEKEYITQALERIDTKNKLFAQITDILGVGDLDRTETIEKLFELALGSSVEDYFGDRGATKTIKDWLRDTEAKGFRQTGNSKEKTDPVSALSKTLRDIRVENKFKQKWKSVGSFEGVIPPDDDKRIKAANILDAVKDSARGGKLSNSKNKKTSKPLNDTNIDNDHQRLVNLSENIQVSKLASEPKTSLPSVSASDNKKPSLSHFVEFCHDEIGYFSREEFNEETDVNIATETNLANTLASRKFRILLIHGKAGNGKTTLLNYLNDTPSLFGIENFESRLITKSFSFDPSIDDSAELTFIDYAEDCIHLSKIANIVEDSEDKTFVLCCRSSRHTEILAQFPTSTQKVIKTINISQGNVEEIYRAWVCGKIISRGLEIAEQDKVDKVVEGCSKNPALCAYFVYSLTKTENGRKNRDKIIKNTLAGNYDFRNWVTGFAEGNSIDHVALTFLFLNLPYKLDSSDLAGFYWQLDRDGILYREEDESGDLKYSPTHDLFSEIIISHCLDKFDNNHFERIKNNTSSFWNENTLPAVLRNYERYMSSEYKSENSFYLLDIIIAHLLNEPKIAASIISNIISSNAIPALKRHEIIKKYQEAHSFNYEWVANNFDSYMKLLFSLKQSAYTKKIAMAYEKRLRKIVLENSSDTRVLKWLVEKDPENYLEAAQQYFNDPYCLTGDSKYKLIYLASAMAKTYKQPGFQVPNNGTINSMFACLEQYSYLPDAYFLIYHLLALRPKQANSEMMISSIRRWLGSRYGADGSKNITKNESYFVFRQWLCLGGDISHLLEEFDSWRTQLTYPKGDIKLFRYIIEQSQQTECIRPGTLEFCKEEVCKFISSETNVKDHRFLVGLITSISHDPEIFGQALKGIQKKNDKTSEAPNWFYLSDVDVENWQGFENMAEEIFSSAFKQRQHYTYLEGRTPPWRYLINWYQILENSRERENVITWISEYFSSEPRWISKFFKNWFEVTGSLKPFHKDALNFFHYDKEYLLNLPKKPIWLDELKVDI